MPISTIINATELGLIYGLVTLALFLSYSMLNVCDLSTDGCFIFGGAVGSMVALAGYPILSIPAAMGAGMLSGLVVGLLQTRLGVDSLLSGIVVNTAMYSVNIAVMGKSNLNLNKTPTLFTMLKAAIADTPLKGYETLIIAAAAALLVILFQSLFLRTRAGLAIRATGNNPDMVKSSSINPLNTTLLGLIIANAFTGLAGCLFAESQKRLDINDGTGVVTVALASLLIGRVFFGQRMPIPLRALGAVIGAIIFRLVYAFALQMHMPANMLRAVSSTIVVLTISLPYLRKRLPLLLRRFQSARKEGGEARG